MLWLDGPFRRKAPAAEARAIFERRYAATLDLLVSALAPPRGRSPRRSRRGRVL
jgi:hypothetical protein